MKIAHVSTYPGQDKKAAMDGVTSYTELLLNNIPWSESDTVYVLANQLSSFETYSEGRLHIIRCYKKNSPFYVLQIYKQIKKLDVDVVHVQQELGLFGNLLTAYLLQWLFFMIRKRNLIVTLHGVVSIKSIDRNFIKSNNSSMPVWMVKLAFRIIYKPLCVWPKSIIVHEDEFKLRLIREYGVSEAKIVVIPHGVGDFKRSDKATVRHQLNIRTNWKVVLFMGYLTGYKGLDLLIEGFANYAKKEPKALLLIGAGKHPKLASDPNYLKNEYYRLKNKAATLIPPDNYRWVGFIKQSEVGVYFSCADVSVYPYTVVMSTSGPKAISIGYGVPFIASEVFDPVVEDKSLLFANDPDSLASCLSNFFMNQSKYNEKIQALRPSLLWSRIGVLSLDLYQRQME